MTSNLQMTDKTLFRIDISKSRFPRSKYYLLSIYAINTFNASSEGLRFSHEYITIRCKRLTQ